MNDQQLSHALRALGTRPATPDPGFAEQLWDQLAQSHARRRPAISRELLLVAAMLVLVGLAIALAVGTNLFQNRQLLVEASIEATQRTQETLEPLPTDEFPFPVEIPDGVEPVSAIADVEAAALAVDDADFGLDGGGLRVNAMFLLAPGRTFPDLADGWTSRPDPVWGIQVANQEEFLVALYLVDNTLEVAGVEPPDNGEPDPEATIEVLPTWDPAEPLALIRDGGETVRVTQIPVFEPGLPWSPGAPVAMGEVLWLLSVPIYTEDPPHLVRVDMNTGATTRVAAPDVRFGTLVAGIDRLWLADETLYALDPVSGEVLETRPAPSEGSLMSEDETGLWWRAIGGALLTDPDTGEELRRISFEETGDQAYTGIWQPPAFGSLWDVDRGTGRVYRLDPVTGAELAVINTGDLAPGLCDDPQALIGVDALPPLMMVNCTGEVYFIDPSSNTIVRSVRIEGTIFAAAGQLWSLAYPGFSGAWWLPGSISRIDPLTGTAIEILTLNRDRTSGRSYVVAADSLWMIVGEQAQPNQGHDHNTTLIRIPLSELAG